LDDEAGVGEPARVGRAEITRKSYRSLRSSSTIHSSSFPFALLVLKAKFLFSAHKIPSNTRGRWRIYRKMQMEDDFTAAFSYDERNNAVYWRIFHLVKYSPPSQEGTGLLEKTSIAMEIYLLIAGGI
jgi:hypothetical protein